MYIFVKRTDIYIFLKCLARTWLRRSIRTVDDRPAAPRYSTSWLPSRARSCRSEAGRRNRRNNAKPEIWSIPRDRRSNILDPSLPRKDPRLDPRLTNRTVPSLAASCWNCSPPVLPPRDSLKIDEVIDRWKISKFLFSPILSKWFISFETTHRVPRIRNFHPRMWPTGTVPTAWTTPRNLSLPAIALVAFFWTVPAITFLYRHTRDDILSKYIYQIHVL